jgi:hypothetical protein
VGNSVGNITQWENSLLQKLPSSALGRLRGSDSVVLRLDSRGPPMPDQRTYIRHADELRAQAALERDPVRRRYWRGLARSYEEMGRLRGEPERPKRPPRPIPPAIAERANLAASLRNLGYSQSHIAKQLGVSAQLISQILLGLQGRGPDQRLAALRSEKGVA